MSAPDDDTPAPLGPGHFAELVDRASVFASNVEEFLCNYPGLEEQYPKLHGQVLGATESLAGFYADAAQVLFEMEESNDG